MVFLIVDMMELGRRIPKTPNHCTGGSWHQSKAPVPDTIQARQNQCSAHGQSMYLGGTFLSSLERPSESLWDWMDRRTETRYMKGTSY